MRRVVVFGAGLVAAPLVRYLLDLPDVAVDVRDVEPGRAAALVAGRPRGSSGPVDIRDAASTADALRGAALAVSLVPNTFHPLIARACIAAGANMVTASYVSPAMRELDAPARAAGVLLLNELGLDPGIDHMEAIRVIRRVHDGGGRVLEFVSYCGGLPAPEANTNPFGYKFSWSPRGVLTASRSAARFLRDGEVVSIPAERLFTDGIRRIPFPGLGEFDGYPNRDSVQYRELYGISEARTVLRGTLRYPGWAPTMKAVGDLGYLEQEERALAGLTYGGLTGELAGARPGERPREAVRRRLALTDGSGPLANMEWLGLFSDRPVPLERGGPIDALTALMVDRLAYAPGERDMVALQHEFLAEGAGGRRERIRSTLVDYGVPGGDSSMSRLVGLPAAIASRLILDGAIALAGVQIPVRPEVYVPVLGELETLGIAFRETREPAD